MVKERNATFMKLEENNAPVIILPAAPLGVTQGN